MIRAAWFAAFALSVVAANALTSAFGLVQLWPTGLMVTAGTFAAGAALVLRDGVDTHGGRWWVIAAITVGIALSFGLAPAAIAVASAVAFGGSELLDWGVFRRLRPRSLPRAVLLSSVIAAPVDTILFLAIAFGWGAVTWQAVLGQFIVKTAMAGLAAAWLTVRAR